MEVSTLKFIAYLIAGILAGVINTLAGGGSLFSLSLLLFFGVPANIANGTNRFGILLQNLTGTYTFQKSGLLKIKDSLKYVIPAIIGSIIGAVVAVLIEPEHLETVVGVLMVFMLADMVFKGKKKVKAGFKKKKISPTLNFIIFLGIGFYGGFVQAGIGILIIAALSKVTNLTLIRSNAIKMVIIFLYTIPVFAIFIFTDQVSWKIASVLAGGQVAGTWFASKFAVGHPKINTWVRWVLMAMVILSIIKMFKLHLMVMEQF